MNDCSETLSLLNAHVAGALTPERAAQVREHLQGCPDCRAVAASESALHGALARATVSPEGDTVVPRLLTRARERAHADARPRRAWRRVLAAAVLLLALGMGLMVALGPPCLRGDCPTMQLVMEAVALSEAPPEAPQAGAPSLPGLVPVGGGRLEGMAGPIPVTVYAHDGTRLVLFQDPGAHTHFWQVERLADGREYVDRTTADGKRLLGWVDGEGRVWCYVGGDAERTFALARELRQRAS